MRLFFDRRHKTLVTEKEVETEYYNAEKACRPFQDFLDGLLEDRILKEITLETLDALRVRLSNPN